MVSVAARFRWGIKESYLAYVGMLPDSTVVLSAGATRTVDGLFEFAADPEPVDGSTLRFRGTVSITGHGGVMQVTLTDPWLEPADEGVHVTTLFRGIRTAVAIVPQRHGTPARWFGPVPTQLTATGADWLGGVYPDGDDADPIELH